MVDLTHELSEETPVFPGGVGFKKEAVATFEQAGYLAHRLELGEHTGTHVDAPIHFNPEGLGIGEVPADRLIGPGVRVSVAERVVDDPDALAEPEDFIGWEERHGPIPEGAVVLIHTGWAGRWADEGAYRNADEKGRMHFPGLSAAAAGWLVERRASAVGIDTLSVDPGLSQEFRAHEILSRAGVLAIENLTGLEQLPEAGFTVVVAPLKIRGGSGSPARVLAIWEEGNR